MIETARDAIYLWAIQLVPSLLPFMILTNLFTPFLYRYISINSKKGAAFLYKVSGLSIQGCCILLIGQLCGYPLGAKMTGEAYKQGRITRSEANYLLTICNQSSPAFLEFYVGIFALNRQIPTPILFILFYFSTIITSFFTRKLYKPEFIPNNTESDTKNTSNFFEQLDKSITDGCITILRIGGYILIFAVGSYFIQSLFSSLGGSIYFVTALLEITNGLSMLKEHFYTHSWYSYFILTLTAFGGFCTMAQIKGMLVGTSLSIKPYFIGKIIYTAVVIVITLLFGEINRFFCFQ